MICDKIENETVAIIQRGATVDILTDLTCSFLYSHETNLDNYQVILVKLSAEINNLLHRENILSDISPQQFIDKLLFFESTPLAALLQFSWLFYLCQIRSHVT
jgi:hypothetical protein